MTARPLSSLCAGAGLVPLTPIPPDLLVSGVKLDSRSIERGDLFVALRGAVDDGARHAREAVAKGAAAILTEAEAPAPLPGVPWIRVHEARRALGLLAREWHGRPDETLTLVGITGTKGKTTVTYLVESIASAANVRTGRIGTVGYAFGDREVPASRTTPEATDLYALLAAMRDEGARIVAMEVSSHALTLHRVAGARFPVAAFLNLGKDHLEFHGGHDAYFDAKASLFERLGASDTAVLPSDDPHGARLAARTKARILTFGRAGEADVRIEHEQSGLSGSAMVLRTPAGRLETQTPLPGAFNVENAAAAAACGIALGLDGAAIARGIGSLRSVPGRLEPVASGQPFAVFVDYAHTEESLGAALEAVRALAPGGVHVVFGCGGDRDRGKRFGMGRAAALLADRIVLTSDNPRSEDPAEILREVEAGVRSVEGAPERCRTTVDRALAIRWALEAAHEGDAVLIAGKGHETTQTTGGRVEPFDDRQVAREALRRLGFGGGSRAEA